MFYYYGRKKKIASHYPPPKCNTIVEPFAGSAAYSLHGDNWKKNVILIEKDERVANIWKWLIEQAVPDDILSLPDLQVGDKTSEFIHIIHAAAKWAFTYKTIKVTPILATNWKASKKYIASNIHKVKHWKIICDDYKSSSDIEATWFIDPPYKGSPGLGYKQSSSMMDYDDLVAWTKKRRGEVIFCEGENADYLPFKPLLTVSNIAGKKNKEYVYYRSDIFDELFYEETE